MKIQFKSLIAGIIIGVMLFSGVTVIAANYQAVTANFPIYINGEEWEADSEIVTIDGRTYVPLKALGDVLGVNVSWNEEFFRVEIERPDTICAMIETTDETEQNSVNKILRFPVLMYHNSSEIDPPEDPDGIYVPELFVKPSEFENQIKYLSENDYTFCIFDDWYDLYDIEKPVFITFDDGYEENYTEIFPILKKYNAKITIFLVTNPYKEKILTPEMVREMSKSGLVKFESHTLTHVDLEEISPDEEKLTEELRDSKRKIEEMTGKRVHAIAYPGGKFNAEVRKKTKEFYQFGITTIWGMHRTTIDNYAIRRLSVDRGMSIDDFIKLLDG